MEFASCMATIKINVILLSKCLSYSTKDQKSYKEHKYGFNFYLGQIGISYFDVRFELNSDLN